MEWELPPGAQPPHRVGQGAHGVGRWHLAVTVGAVTRDERNSTGTVWTESAFAQGIQGWSTDHFPSPPHIFKVISSSYTGFNTTFVQGLPDSQSSWTALPGSIVLIDKGTWTQASPHIQTQVLCILPRTAPPPVSSASSKGQLHLLGCSGRCFESGVPHTLPICSLSPMPLPPLIICHLTTAAAARLDPLLAPHTPTCWWQNRSQLCSGSESTFQLQVKMP